MAIIRNNRGALLAGNLSKYLSNVANTAGTPIDTNEVVNILNQFLATEEAVGTNTNTTVTGIYKRFNEIDKIVNRTEVVTSGIWSGDTGSLDLMYTSSVQKASDSGKYYLDVYNLDPELSDAAEVQFSITYGHISGGAVPTLGQSDDSLLQTKAIYGQFRNILLGPTDTFFTVYASGSSGLVSNGYNLDHFYALAVNRARSREKLDPGNIEITLSGSNGTITLIDDSGQINSIGASGRIFNLVSGALNIGTSNEGTISQYVDSYTQQGYGLFYPDLGIFLLNPAAISSSVGTLFESSSVAATYSNKTNIENLYTALDGGSSFQARRTENVSTSHFFVRVNNREFNYSNNPTFVTGSTGQFVQTLFETDPHVYVTSVGLYDDANELLAVAKISKPIEKTFDKEILIKVKLDF
jgi:hypothetical protein